MDVLSPESDNVGIPIQHTQFNLTYDFCLSTLQLANNQIQDTTTHLIFMYLNITELLPCKKWINSSVDVIRRKNTYMSIIIYIICVFIFLPYFCSSCRDAARQFFSVCIGWNHTIEDFLTETRKIETIMKHFAFIKWKCQIYFLGHYICYYTCY